MRIVTGCASFVKVVQLLDLLQSKQLESQYVLPNKKIAFSALLNSFSAEKGKRSFPSFLPQS